MESDPPPSTPSGLRRGIASAASASAAYASAAKVKLSAFGAQVRSDEDASRASALQAGAQFNILDVYTSAAENEVDVAFKLKAVEAEEERLRLAGDGRGAGASSGCCGKLASRIKKRVSTFSTSPASWVFLITLGLAAGLVAVLVDLPVFALWRWRGSLVEDAGTGGGFFIWVLWCVAFALASAFLAYRWPHSEGSGLPQLKAILAGSTMPKFLGLRVGLAKVIGLALAQGSGLSIGREGPFIHVTATVAHALLRLPFFATRLRGETVRRQLLTVAVSAGVAAVFGTPIGGVLFAIETTSTYLSVNVYFFAMVGAAVCRVVFDIITVLKSDTFLDVTDFPYVTFSAEILGFVGLGILCGVIASIFVYCVNKVRIARKLMMTTPRRRFILVASVAATMSALLYSTHYLRQNDRNTMNALFVTSNTAEIDAWAAGDSLFVALPVFIIVRLLATVTSISLPLACGLAVPLFGIGAAVGRLFGEVIAGMFPSAGVMPGLYAVIGASALVSGATQTVSTAVIMFEMTGQVTHAVPVLVGTLVAYATASVFTISVFDMLLSLSNLPYLPRVLSSDVYALAAKDVMHRDVPTLWLGMTWRDAKKALAAAAGVAAGAGSDATSGHTTLALDESGSSGSGDGAAAATTTTSADGTRVQLHGRGPQSLAVVASFDSRVLVGSVSRLQLEKVICKAYEAATALRASASDSVVSAGSSEAGGEVAGFGASTSSSSSGGASAATGVTLKHRLTAAAIARRNELVKAFADEQASVASMPDGDFDAEWLDSPVRFLGLDKAAAKAAAAAVVASSSSGSSGGSSATSAPSPVTASTLPPSLAALQLFADPAPFQLPEDTPLAKVHYLMAIALFAEIFITRSGRFVGVVLKEDLANSRRVSRDRLLAGASDSEGHSPASGILPPVTPEPYAALVLPEASSTSSTSAGASGTGSA